MSFPTLEQIVGHAAVLADLRHVVALDRPGHAYLFFGPPGVGKATIARAFVQALFCPARTASHTQKSGCGHCLTCRKIAQGQHCDLVQVEMATGKTRISVEQIRDLLGFFSMTAMEASWKAAIIDDAATMNEAAASALLKTLEEPSAHSILILVTHRVGQLLPTIRSRCLKIRFSSLATSEVRHILTTMTTVDDETLTEALACGGGHLGRTLAFTQGELPKLRKQFRQAMATLPTATLGQLSILAEQWSRPEIFAQVVMLLRAWFREQLQASLTLTSRPLGAEGGRGGGGREAWLKVLAENEQLLQQAAIFNLNHRLVLEAVFIHLARVQGASY